MLVDPSFGLHVRLVVCLCVSIFLYTVWFHVCASVRLCMFVFVSLPFCCHVIWFVCALLFVCPCDCLCVWAYVIVCVFVVFYRLCMFVCLFAVRLFICLFVCLSVCVCRVCWFDVLSCLSVCMFVRMLVGAFA